MLPNLNKMAIGTVQFGQDYGINNFSGKVPIQEVYRILCEAERNGIDTIDTAAAYGTSENVLGETLGKISKSWKVISKFSPKSSSVFIEFQETLRRLSRTCLYGYLIHDFTYFISNPSIWNELAAIKKEEKVERIGFSVYRPVEIEELLVRNINFTLVQVPYSIFDRRFESIFPILKERDIEIHIRSVFLQGLLLRKPASLGSYFDSIKIKLQQLHDFASKKSIPMTALCLCFALLQKQVDKVIIGIDSLANLKENICSLEMLETVEQLYSDLECFKEENPAILLPSNWAK